MTRQRENRTTPKITAGILYTDDQFTGTPVGSAPWFTWLQTASTFYYEGQQGTFTARRESKQRGGAYWSAYRQIDGKLHKKYLGKAEALSADRLAATALDLASTPLARTDQPSVSAPDLVQIKLKWKERDALRYASRTPEIWRDVRTRRGVHSLCLLGLLIQTRTTKTRAYYAITEAGRAVAAQLPTDDEEWADTALDVFDPAKLNNRQYAAQVDPAVWARVQKRRL